MQMDSSKSELPFSKVPWFLISRLSIFVLLLIIVVLFFGVPDCLVLPFTIYSSITLALLLLIAFDVRQTHRPLFGTVHFRAPKFANPVHAARYATKYLIKSPEHGFPEWVLAMGKDRRVRRYSTSKGFWRTPPKLKSEPQRTRNNKKLSYRERINKCGNSIHVFEMNEFLDLETGEIQIKRYWLGQMGIHSSVLDRLFDPGNPQRRRRSLLAKSLPDAVKILEIASGQKPQWIRRRLTRTGK